ncbi:alpha-amylase [bacterium]|nr:alpha-amylase [bacterium]
MKLKNTVLAMAAACLLAACGGNSKKIADNETQPTDTLNQTPMKDISWVNNAVIYEVNVRQYTPEGNFAGFEKHLPRLKKLGVDILWFMPIYPIGVKNRKESEASLGSYYAVKDYTAVNPDFGSMDDFKALVDKCHEMGFKVVLDWVANHSAPDNIWVTEHPEYYTKDSAGNYPIPPLGTDWTDVADLDYDNAGLRQAMTEAMKFWVDNCDIDGFRCDVAGEVPLDFWVEARPQLEQNKPLFMLAEWEDVDYYKAFDFSYAWHFNHLMTEVSQGRATVDDIVEMSCRPVVNWMANDLEGSYGVYNKQMNFTTNHDENSWKNSVFERLGAAHKMWAAMAFTVPGLPLIYSGQEVGNGKTLKFFDKDEIDWSQDSLSGFYTDLVALKHTNDALWIGPDGGSFEPFKIEDNKNIYAFYRKGKQHSFMAFFNLSHKAQQFTIPEQEFLNDFELNANELTLKPWGYQFFTK